MKIFEKFFFLQTYKYYISFDSALNADQESIISFSVTHILAEIQGVRAERNLKKIFTFNRPYLDEYLSNQHKFFFQSIVLIEFYNIHKTMPC
jgi:hypothetical protein